MLTENWHELNSHENPNVWRLRIIGQNIVPRSLIRIPMPDSVAPFPLASQVLWTNLLGDVAVVEELCLLVGLTLSPSIIPSLVTVGALGTTTGFGKTERS